MGEVANETPTMLVADADALDYRESDLDVLTEAGRRIAQLAVLPDVLEEVRNLSDSRIAKAAPRSGDRTAQDEEAHRRSASCGFLPARAAQGHVRTVNPLSADGVLQRGCTGRWRERL